MKKIAFIAVFILFLTITVNVSANTHIPILLYHDVQTEYPEEKAISTISPQVFEEHIVALLNNGYTPVDFDDIYNASEGKFVMPEKPVVICFDDGYIGNYTHAYPILCKYGVKATIFVVAQTVGHILPTSVHFDWEHARIMQQSGLVSIQSHTYSHSDLTLINNFQIEREFRLSKYLIEKNLGTKCNYVAFPYGFYNQYVQEAAKRAGYIITSQVGNIGINTVAGAQSRPLIRITTFGSWSGEDVLNVIAANAK